MRKILWIACVFVFILDAVSAFADTDRLMALIRILRDNGTITPAQYEMLVNAAEDNTPVAPPPSPPAGAGDLKVSTEGGVFVATYDGRFSFELGGRLMVDAAFYDEDDVVLGDGTELRRARIELAGHMFSDWEYEFGIDFSDGDAEIKDAYLAYTGHWPLMIRVGQFFVPFSLEELTSSKYFTFMESGLPNVFVPGRKIGFGGCWTADIWTLSGGLFGESFDEDADDEGDEGWLAAGRITVAPFHSDTRALHLGAGVFYEVPGDEKTVRFDARPESHVTDVRFVDTGKIKKVDALLACGFEGAWVMGPFSLQGEYLYAELNRDSGARGVHFDGWYVYGSWFVTGESRAYRFEKGAFGAIRPVGKYGALELALRYSTIDLSDGPVLGGQEDNVTVGINWYLNPRVRIMNNLIFVDNDLDADMDGDVAGGDDPQIFQTRFQLTF